MDFEKKKGRWAFEQWRAKFQIGGRGVEKGLLAHVQDFQEKQSMDTSLLIFIAKINQLVNLIFNIAS